MLLILGCAGLRGLRQQEISLTIDVKLVYGQLLYIFVSSPKRHTRTKQGNIFPQKNTLFPNLNDINYNRFIKFTSFS